mmetsp:Transcript_17544/g.31455  ORF Transcript_17544/g.31455 Transcript_17544/m.31455 type:complete len:691 (+) Transcript_17544:55-2127(+)
MCAPFIPWALALPSLVLPYASAAASLTRREHYSPGPSVQISPSGAALFEQRHAGKSHSGRSHRRIETSSSPTPSEPPPPETTVTNVTTTVTTTTTTAPLTDIGQGCCQDVVELFSDTVDNEGACKARCSEDTECIGIMYGWQGKYDGKCKTFSHCRIPLEDCGENGETVRAYITWVEISANGSSGGGTRSLGFVDMGAGCCTDPEVVYSGKVDIPSECKDRCQGDPGCNAYMTGWPNQYCMTASKCGLPKRTGPSDCQFGGDSGVHLYISDVARVPMLSDENQLSSISIPIPPGACVNKRSKSETTAEVSCPEPLVNVACNCHTQSTAGCGTAFLDREKCKAITSNDTTIEAVARCCNIEWSWGWEVAMSELSGVTDGAAADVTCPKNKTRVGCACMPQDESPGCMGVEAVNESSCRAYNAVGHAAGVKAVAKCAFFGEQDEFDLEIDRVGRDAEYFPTFTSCPEGENDNTMLSCQCSNVVSPEVKECFGGSVTDQQCQCWGKGCWVTAVCAHLVVPAEDCEWADWADWSQCSVSCGKGSRSHTRTIKKGASYGGNACSGEATEVMECADRALNHTSCAPPKPEKEKKEEEPEDHTLIIVIPVVSGVLVCCCFGLVGFCFFYNQRRKRLLNAAAIKAAAAGLDVDLAEEVEEAEDGEGAEDGEPSNQEINDAFDVMKKAASSRLASAFGF